MLSQSKMPNFKKGDLVMSTVALPVARTALTKPGAAIQDRNNPQQYSCQSIPINSAPIQGLLIQAGVVFEVDAVLPWNTPDDNPSKCYRLVLNSYHSSQLDEQQRQLTEAEFSSLNIILGEEDTRLPFYTYADDHDYGFKISWAHRYSEACVADAQVASALEITEGSPVMYAK